VKNCIQGAHKTKNWPRTTFPRYYYFCNVRDCLRPSDVFQFRCDSQYGSHVNFLIPV